MTHRIFPLFILLSSLIVFVSCSQYVYMPTEHHVMPFKQKGEAEMSINSGLKSNLGVTAGYALTDNIGLLTAYNCMDLNVESYDHHRQYGMINSFIWDNEFVWYKKLNSSLVTGVNVGCGLGRLNNDEYYYYNYNRQYFLPWIGGVSADLSNANVSFYWAFSTKLSQMNYHLKTNFQINSDYDREMYRNYFDATDFSLFTGELGFTVGINFSLARIQWQTLYFIRPEYYSQNIYPFNSVVSISFLLNKIFHF